MTLLDVRVHHARDVPGAQEGGADRLWLATEAGLSPDLQVVSSVLRMETMSASARGTMMMPRIAMTTNSSMSVTPRSSRRFATLASEVTRFFMGTRPRGTGSPAGTVGAAL